jgi:hypothetical protein
LSAFIWARSDETAAVIGGKPAPGFEIDTLKVPDKTNQRIERAGKLPARSRDFLRGGR